MHKNNLFTGQPIFNQLLGLIPRTLINNLVRTYNCDHYCKRFLAYDHLVTMLFSTFHQCNSIREVITGMQASSSRLMHLGLKFTPRRSTLADANKRRSADFFQALYHNLYSLYYGSLPDSLRGKKLTDRLFIVDSSIISLFTTVMQSTGNFGLNGKKKGGVKAHLLMRYKDNLPCFIHISEGKHSDNSFLKLISLPAGSIIVIDKGYRSFAKFIEWTKSKITWVTRLNERFVYQTVSERLISDKEIGAGVVADYEILLGNPETIRRNALQKARLIVYFDKVTNKEFKFITNNFQFAPSTIANIYKKRWQIEILFKRIKQNFQLQYFLGDNENAIRIQLWCAFIADLLLKIIKDRTDRRRKWSFANLASLIRLHLNTYIDLYKFLNNPEKALIKYVDPGRNMQLKLFKLQTRGA